IMSSVCTLRLKRRRAFSRGSPSCTRTSAKRNTPPDCPSWDIYIRIPYLEKQFVETSIRFSPVNRRTRKMAEQERCDAPRDWLDRLRGDRDSVAGEVPRDRP